GTVKDLGSCLGDRACKGALEPLLEVAIGHADDEDLPVDPVAGVASKPEFIAGLADPPGYSIGQCGEGAYSRRGRNPSGGTPTGRHGLPPDIALPWIGQAANRATRHQGMNRCRTGVKPSSRWEEPGVGRSFGRIQFLPRFSAPSTCRGSEPARADSLEPMREA